MRIILFKAFSGKDKETNRISCSVEMSMKNEKKFYIYNLSPKDWFPCDEAHVILYSEI